MTTEQQHEIDQWYVDLPGLGFGCVIGLHARQEAQLDGLAGNGKRSGDNRLRRNNGGGSRQQHQGQLQFARRKQEKGIGRRSGI